MDEINSNYKDLIQIDDHEVNEIPKGHTRGKRDPHSLWDFDINLQPSEVFPFDRPHHYRQHWQRSHNYFRREFIENEFGYV